MGKSYGAGCRRTETTGRGVTCCESGSLGALCHGFPLLFPHFMAIAWMCREDYARAGYLSSTFGRAERSFCGLAELGCFAGSYPAGFDSDDRWRIRARLFGRGPHTWFDIFFTAVQALPFAGRMSRRDICSLVQSFIFPRCLFW